MSQLILKSAEAGSGSITITAQETNEDINIVFPSTSGTLFVGNAEGYAPINNPTFTGIVTGTFSGNLTGNASTATRATQDGSGNVITSTYATKTELSGYQPVGDYVTNSTLTTQLATKLGKTEKAASATVADSANSVAGANVSGTVANATNAVNATKATQDGSGNVITSTYATKTELSDGLDGKSDTNHTHTTYIPKTGDAGTVSCYTSIGTSSSITASSPDASQVSSSSVSVANGTSGTSWTKIVRLTASSPSVSLGSSWKWQGGSAPTLSQNGFLVLGWCGSGGIAIFNAVS